METGPLVEFWIEIDKDSQIKNEFNKQTNSLEIDRISLLPYPYAYGFFPNTLADDGDELDMIWIHQYSDPYINSDQPFKTHGYIVGGLVMEDEKGMDEKIFVVSPDQYEEFIQKPISETSIIFDKIINFFENYKKNIPGKWSKCHYIIDQYSAIKKYRESVK